MTVIYFFMLCANFGFGLYCGLKYRDKLVTLWEQVW